METSVQVYGFHGGSLIPFLFLVTKIQGLQVQIKILQVITKAFLQAAQHPKYGFNRGSIFLGMWEGRMASEGLWVVGLAPPRFRKRLRRSDNLLGK